MAKNYKVCVGCRTFTKVENIRKTGTICGQCGNPFILACAKCRYTITNPKQKYCYNCGTKYPWIRSH